MRRASVLWVLLCAGALPLATAALHGQSVGRDGATSKVVQLQKLKDNLYLLKGGGGNTVVFITDLGVVIVDTKGAGWGPRILDTIKTITSKKVITIINTDAHPDHVGGNELFGTAVEIVAHQNTRANMERSGAFADQANFLPKLMFKEKMPIGAGKDRIELYYFGSGHTSGDAWVVFPALRVMYAGDMFPSKQPPMVDGNTGGSGLAYPDTLAKAAATLKDIVDIVITGDDGVMTVADLDEYARFTRDFRDVVVDGFHHGLSVEDVVARWKVPDRYKGYGAGDPQRVRGNVEFVFAELAK
jgi:cyclase